MGKHKWIKTILTAAAYYAGFVAVMLVSAVLAKVTGAPNGILYGVAVPAGTIAGHLFALACSKKQHDVCVIVCNMIMVAMAFSVIGSQQILDENVRNGYSIAIPVAFVCVWVAARRNGKTISELKKIEEHNYNLLRERRIKIEELEEKCERYEAELRRTREKCEELKATEKEIELSKMLVEGTATEEMLDAGDVDLDKVVKLADCIMGLRMQTYNNPGE